MDELGVDGDEMKREEAKQHIERIRAEKFGITPDGRKQQNSLERDLCAAVKNLAEELNGKETHFILELLQNAEDNTYPVGVKPELFISVSVTDPTGTGGDGCLCLFNNEVGFTPEQVLSLCSVGQSTKEKAGGYIGEKGIGFKSVFRVSDKPHIFSNGYQFCFHKPQRLDDLGYIVPHWVEFVPDVVRSGFTCILLPLVTGKRNGIAEKLQAVPAETILFLSKLRRLGIGETHFIDRDKTAGVVKLLSGTDESLYFVHRQNCPRPNNLDEQKRGGIIEREVTIALPLKSARPCNGRVFAFLPTELDTGLPFLVNADFLLSASRDYLLEDRHWNRWLRDEIAPAFVNTFLSVLRQPEWKTTVYRLLPISSDLTSGADFFTPIVTSIQDRLQVEKCILSSSGKCVLPKNVLFAGPLARFLLRDALPDRLKFALLHPDLECHLDRLTPLGVKVLNFAQLFEVFDDEVWLCNRDTDWWVILFDLLTQCEVKAEVIGTFPIFRCRDSKCRPLSSRVYFHAEDQPTPSSIQEGWPVVDLLDTDIQNRLQKNPKIWAWVVRVTHLCFFSIQSYIVNSLLDWMLEQKSGHNVCKLIDATRFIALNLKYLDEKTIIKLGKKIPWALADGRVISARERGDRELVTPECLEGDTGWNWVFISADDRQHFCILDDRYLQGQSAVVSKAIKELMRKCGAINCPNPAPGFRLHETVDWGCPRWLRDLSADHPPQNLLKKVVALERWINRFKSDHFVQFLSRGLEGGTLTDSDPANVTELGLALRTRPWLRTTKGLVQPTTAFVHDPEIKQFLGDSVPYVETKLSSEILGKLGVRDRLSAGALFDLLRQMRDSGKVNEVLVVRIYHRLQTMDFDADTFRMDPLVYLSRPEACWIVSNRIVWKDAGDVFDGEFGYAELTYRNDELHGFFTKTLGVQEEVSEQRLAEVWAEMSGLHSLRPEVVEKRLHKILTRLADVIEVNNPPEWWSLIRCRMRVWTIARRFEVPRSVFAPDETFAEEVFARTAPIAWVPKSHLTAHLNRLLRDLGCQSLAENLRNRVKRPATVQLFEKPQLLTSATKEMLVCWVCFGDAWRKKRLQLEQLLKSEEVGVGALEVEYWLEGIGTSPSIIEADAYWASDDLRLYLKQGATSKAQQSAAANSIAAHLGQLDKQDEDTVYRLLGLETDDARREMAKRKWKLAPEQQRWLQGLDRTLEVVEISSDAASRILREARPSIVPDTKGRSASTGLLDSNEVRKSGFYTGHNG